MVSNHRENCQCIICSPRKTNTRAVTVKMPKIIMEKLNHASEKLKKTKISIITEALEDWFIKHEGEYKEDDK